MPRVTPSGSSKGILICYVHLNTLVKYTPYHRLTSVALGRCPYREVGTFTP